MMRNDRRRETASYLILVVEVVKPLLGVKQRGIARLILRWLGLMLARSMRGVARKMKGRPKWTLSKNKSDDNHHTHRHLDLPPSGPRGLSPF